MAQLGDLAVRHRAERPVGEVDEPFRNVSRHRPGAATFESTHGDDHTIDRDRVTHERPEITRVLALSGFMAYYQLNVSGEADVRPLPGGET